jgi:predicted house-cleaning NTP pyrophosphatase (Maf/HAM1 superfamily)
VFAAQTESNFAGYSSEDLVGRVNHKPLVHHVSGFGAEGFHEFSLKKRFGRLFSTVGFPLKGIS